MKIFLKERNTLQEDIIFAEVLKWWNYNKQYRYNAKYLQFDWLKQRAYFWYF